MAYILTLNSGSSSIKFALFENGGEPIERVRGQVEGLGAKPRLKVKADGYPPADEALDAEHRHRSRLGTLGDPSLS